VSNRLVGALTVLLSLIIPGAFYSLYHSGVPTALAVFTVGVVGGVVGLQRRLKQMSDDDLTLLANSWVYVGLSPLVGGILAIVTYVFFISGILQGDFFPKFLPDESAGNTRGLATLFAVHGATAEDYGKMLLWGFISGFSERFTTDIISRFESQTVVESKPDA
jgi:hypothetical protein